MSDNTAAVKAAIRVAAERGLLQSAEHVLKVAKDHVPHEEGTLERSGTTSIDGLKAAVSFDTPYAVAQHEDLTAHHDDPDRTAKYLENAFNSERNKLGQIIATEIRKATS